MAKKRLKKKFKLIFKLLIIIPLLILIKNVIFTKKLEKRIKPDFQVLEENIDEKYAYLPQTDTFDKLKQLIEKDKKVEKILDNYLEYPEDLLMMLSKNIEMLDFVLEFNNQKGKTLDDNVGKIKKDEIPLLLQWDKRWGYTKYGDNYLAINGCAPTTLSMVIAGLTGNNKITPAVISKYATENGYYVEGIGTSWDIMTVGAKHFGITGTNINLNKNDIYYYLENGNPIICSMAQGDFTATGHFIVLTQIKNGKIKVNDPNSKSRSNKLWDYEILESQIKNLWVFQK